MKKPMLPIGVSNFSKLIRHKNSEGILYTFVDKTLFIKDIIDSGDEIALITRPRRFGKTLNMSMLQHFFASEIHGIYTKGLFDKLKIAKYPETMKYQGQHPVIFLTLKEIRGKDFIEAFSEIKTIIKNLFESHRYLLKSDKIEDSQKKLINKFIETSAEIREYKESLLILSTYLYLHTDKKVIILLDEYDTPLHDAYINKYYDEMRSFIATMFNKAFKGNDFLYKAVITGILKIAKSSLFSELNNVKVYSVLSSIKYGDSFGFTEKETGSLLERVNLTKYMLSLRDMYNGYNIEGHVLYNPFSIINYIDDAVNSSKDPKDLLQAYWVNSGGTQIISDLIKNSVVDLEYGLRKLINKESINTIINPDIVLGTNLKIDEISFWSVMLLAGYLKITNTKYDEYDDIEYELLFPNEEIRISMKNIILQAVGESGTYEYTLAMKSLIRGDIQDFITFLKDYMRYTPSYFDTTDRYKEQFYHGLLLGMTACLSKLYIIKSNRESGKGRYDIAIEPRDIRRKGVIIELKAANEDENLDILAAEALEQIQTKSYKTEMEHRGIKDIIPLGLAFKKNEVVVLSTEK